MRLKRVIVLGSNAFTAGHLIDHLIEKSDCEIVGISRSSEYDSVFLPFLYEKERPVRYRFVQIDVNKNIKRFCTVCDDFRPDVVVNFAAQGEVRHSWKWPEHWYKTNCLSVVSIAEHLKDKDYLRRYVSVSTPEVYGSTALPLTEGRKYRPSTPYGASKLAGDLHLDTLHKRYGFPVIFTRSANLYGRHQQLYRIIPRTIIYLKLGKRIDLHGKGESRRAFIHGRDVAALTMRAIEDGRNGEVYHFSPDDGLQTIGNVVHMICEMMGYRYGEAVNIIEENFGQDSSYFLDASKAKKEFGWQQTVSFEDGVSDTIDWIEKNWDFIGKQPLEYIHKD